MPSRTSLSLPEDVKKRYGNVSNLDASDIALMQHPCSLLSSPPMPRSHNEVEKHERSCGQPAVELSTTAAALPFALVASAAAAASG